MSETMNFQRTDMVTAEQKINEEVAIFTLLDKSLVKIREDENAKRYEGRPKSLGAGRVGHPLHPLPYERGCERATWYEYKQYPSERPFPANLYRIFSMGHAAEDFVVENLRAAGFTVLTHESLPDGSVSDKQFGFACWYDENGNPRYKGFIDGVIVAGPAEINGIAMKYPMLWENKCVNDKKWKKFVDLGVERADGNYYGQVQQYQNFMKLADNPCLFTFLNRETGDLRSELVRFNQRHCQATLNRAQRILEAKGPLILERAASDYEKLPCKWCNYKSQCQADEQNRTGQHATIAPNAIVDNAPGWLKQKD